MPVRLLMQKCRGWGETFHIVQLDISETSGSVGYLFMWEAASTKVGKRHALPW